MLGKHFHLSLDIYNVTLLDYYIYVEMLTTYMSKLEGGPSAGYSNLTQVAGALSSLSPK